MANGRKGVHLRQGKPADIESLLHLENASFANHYYKAHKYTAEDFSFYLSSNRSILLVVTYDSTIVAYVAGAIRRGIGGLDSIAVLPKHRKHSLGRKLIHRFIAEVKKRGCDRISLEVAAPNNGGIRFFQNLGFHKYRLVRSYYGQHLDAIKMRHQI